MSTPTKADQIREALEHAKKFVKYIEQYTDVKIDPFAMLKIDRALSLLADMERDGEVVNTQSILDAAVECFDLGPEDQDAVISFGMKLEDMNAPPDPDAHITDQEQYLKAKQERAKDLDFDCA